MARQGRFNWTGGARALRGPVLSGDLITVSGRCADRGLMLDQRTVDIIDKLVARFWWRTYQVRPKQVGDVRSTPTLRARLGSSMP